MESRFENKEIFVKRINEKVHVSRIIASYLKSSMRNIFCKQDFTSWLRNTLELDEDTVNYIYEFATCGKMELEHI